MSALSQADIRAQYTKIWADEKARSDAGSPSLYCSKAEDAVVAPIYADLLRDLRPGLGRGQGHVLDVGSGAGRWIRFFQERVKPRTILGVDVTAQSVELLRSRFQPSGATTLEFRVADITDPALDLGAAGFDLINIANVLFHIPEPDLYERALTNLRRHVAPGGLVVTTEYLPRTDMRTPWMLVRSRYAFEKLVARAGFRIAEIRAFSIFTNDPMGLDGHDDGPRALFNKVRAQFQSLGNASKDLGTLAFFDELQASVDRAVLAFCRERVADVDLPSQKLVALVPV